jgi:hypothetical protein
MCSEVHGPTSLSRHRGSIAALACFGHHHEHCAAVVAIGGEIDQTIVTHVIDQTLHGLSGQTHVAGKVSHGQRNGRKRNSAKHLRSRAAEPQISHQCISCNKQRAVQPEHLHDQFGQRVDDGTLLRKIISQRWTPTLELNEIGSLTICCQMDRWCPIGAAGAAKHFVIGLDGADYEEVKRLMDVARDDRVVRRRDQLTRLQRTFRSRPFPPMQTSTNSLQLAPYLIPCGSLESCSPLPSGSRRIQLAAINDLERF